MKIKQRYELIITEYSQYNDENYVIKSLENNNLEYLKNKYNKIRNTSGKLHNVYAMELRDWQQSITINEVILENHEIIFEK